MIYRSSCWSPRPPLNARASAGWLFRCWLVCSWLVCWGGAAGQEPSRQLAELRTVAETSDYQATASYEQVMTYCRSLAAASPIIHLDSMGTSHEGRQLPLLVLSSKGIKTARQAAAAEQMVVLGIGNIHAGEVCGKEALLMLARDIARLPKHPLLDDLIVLLAPIYNADGNERVALDNRPNQKGPASGMGQRANAQGLDLNRDHMKLESPAARALAQVLTAWDPALVLDTHTTNGSHHRYALTYDGPRHPATDLQLIRFVRDKFLPAVTQRMEETTDYETFFYGNFANDHQQWLTYPALPRYGTHYVGLRNQIGILSEAYAYAPYRDRVLATRDFVLACFTELADRRAAVAKLLKETRGKQQPEREVAIRFAHQPLPGTFIVKGFEQPADDSDAREGSGKPRDYVVTFDGQARSTLSVKQPFAYLIPPSQQAAVRNLLSHGVKLQKLREDIELDLEVYRITDVARSRRPFQKHRLVTVEAQRERETRLVKAGTLVVPTEQSLAPLIVNLLEPQAADGLTTWNYFDDALAEGDLFPIARLPRRTEMLLAEVSAPDSRIGLKQKITFATVYGRRPVRFGGRPLSVLRWLEDGEHYLVRRDQQLLKIEAETGRSEVLERASDLADLLAEKLQLDSRRAASLAATASRQRDRNHNAGWIRHQSDLYHVTLDGSAFKRLTDSPGEEELAEFSPDGRQIAFVRDYDLYVVDVETATERRLTHGGSALLRNGKADWVYYEEIKHRQWKAFHWSPDSRSIAFQQFDDAPVDTFTVLNHLTRPLAVETERYPLAGRPNPRTRLGLVSITGGGVRWADLSKYSPDNLLISHVVWQPASDAVIFYAQNRTQTWLDANRLSLADGTVTTLFRDQTEAWIESPGGPWHLRDGRFLWLSERDGWNHLYLYGPNGKLIRRVTGGQWEVSRVESLDEAGDWVYFSGTKDSHIARNLYRAGITHDRVERVTSGPGSHQILLSPQHKFVVDSYSDHANPTRVRLLRTDGSIVRTLDTNPVETLEQYDLQPVEMLTIPARDGFQLRATLIKPPGFQPSKKYPVWLQTYAGPHAPSISDSWRFGRASEQLLAHMGILAFRVDPRSASGVGVASTWQAYRQLGVRELEDLEDAVEWLTGKPYVDPERIGMSGHSYGGFMTAYAMTHSQKFAAGIAGAPVTDWRNYDTIYTERYMGTPQDNPDGYDKTSVVKAARDLHGKLLLLHGARDDNVHLANTLQLVHELQRANKQFELMIYPSNRHGISGAHNNRLRIDFIRRTMLPD